MAKNHDQPKPHGAPPVGLREMSLEKKDEAPGARGLTPEKAAIESHQAEGEKAAEASKPGLTVETAKKFRCATKDGLSAIVERLGDGRFKVHVEKLHRADAEQLPVAVDVKQFREVQTKGPDNRLSRPILQDGNGVPRHDAIVAFMIACGIRGSDLGIGCTPLE